MLRSFRASAPAAQSNGDHQAPIPARPRRIVARIGALIGMAALLAGCQTFSGGTVGSRDRVLAEIDRRAVVSDDALATEVGRQILTDGGGNAADAAAAMAASLAVTLPSRAGFAGGGLCLVYDGARNETRTLDFLPRGRDGGGAPAMLAGIAALNAEFGRLGLQRVLIPAEQLARFGHPISAGLANDLQAMAPVFTGDPSVTAVFAGPSGRLLSTGDTLTQTALADALRAIQQGGIAAVVRGPLAIGFADAAARAGAPLATGADGVRARFSTPAAVELGDNRLWFPVEAEAGGAAPALLVAALDEVRDYADAAPEERPHLMAETLIGALAVRGAAGGTIDEDAAAPILAGYDPARATGAVPASGGDTAFGASLVAFSGNYLRKTEMAVACGFTLNGLFGSGRLAPETGMFVAAPAQAGVQAIGGVTLLTNQPTQQALYAGAGSDLPVALTAPLVEALLVERPLREAMAAPRVMPDFSSPSVLVERPVLDGWRSLLEGRGHAVRPAATLGRGTAIHCAFDGFLAAKSCVAAADPRAYGSAVVITR